MGDKIQKKGCGGNCLKCWRNKIKFGNHSKLKKINKKSEKYKIKWRK